MQNKPGWLREYEELIQTQKSIKREPKDGWVISLEDAMDFVEMMYSSERVLDAALRQVEWIREWSARPEAVGQIHKEAADYPLEVFSFLSCFRRWVTLKRDLDMGASSRLVEIHYWVAEWHLDKECRPSDEFIIENLLKLDFVRSEGEM